MVIILHRQAKIALRLYTTLQVGLITVLRVSEKAANLIAYE